METKKTPTPETSQVEHQNDEDVLSDVLSAASRAPGSKTRVWTSGDKALLNLSAKADRNVAYCESDDCQNPSGRTKLRGSRVSLGICSYCQPSER